MTRHSQSSSSIDNQQGSPTTKSGSRPTALNSYRDSESLKNDDQPMRRTIPVTSPAQSGIAMSLPSTAVVDMFGRLFGTILATLVEKCPSALSGSGEGIARTLSGVPRSSDVGIDGPGDPGGDPGAEGVDVLRGLKTELSGLKKRVSDLKGGDGDSEPTDRSAQLDLSLSCLSQDQGRIEFHGIPFRSDCAVDGLIAFLGRVCRGNPHDRGIISATGTPCDGQACYQARNVTELETDSIFCSRNEANQWLSYDFKDMRVAVTHYFLRSNGEGVGGSHLRSWVVEGSDDGSGWRELDRRENVDFLNGANRSYGFAIPSVVESRFIRLRSIGPNWAGNQYLYVRAFELFGGVRLRDSSKPK
jgi:hypothetical protein